MKSWEFLIQQEGNYQWQSLHTSTIELEAGKYRILAKSNRYNHRVEIRVKPPSGETQQQQRHINSQGLMMVLPFTELSPGTTWKIRCCGDILSELLGETWQEQLTLTVAPIAAQNEESPHDQTPNRDTDLTNTNSQYYLQQLEQLLKDKIEPKLIKNSNNFSEKQFKKSIICLNLDQEKLTINSGEDIKLSGKITISDQVQNLALTAKLYYQLKHPETEEIIFSLEFPLSDEKIPYYFTHTLKIPPEIQHQSLIGEVRLETIGGFLLDYGACEITIHQYNPVNYTIELFDLEHENSYTFDLELAQRINAKRNSLELPNTNTYFRLFPQNFYRFSANFTAKIS